MKVRKLYQQKELNKFSTKNDLILLILEKIQHQCILHTKGWIETNENILQSFKLIINFSDFIHFS